MARQMVSRFIYLRRSCHHSARSISSFVSWSGYPGVHIYKLESNRQNLRSFSSQTPIEPDCKDLLIDHVVVNPITSSRIIRNTTLHESYIIEDEVLGIGVSGEVKRIISRTTGQRFALKTLSTVILSKKRWNMLLDEVEIFLKMDHPNICKLIEVYQDDEAVHLVMELCAGELASRLENGKAFSEYEAAAVCLQMLEVLSYLHSQRVCHRDLKLENWIYADSSNSKLMLIDFGLSKRFSNLANADMEGTAIYMAPEIWEGDFDEKCDIWAIGVIMYALLSGSLPYEGHARNEVTRLIMMQGFPLTGSQWDSVSDLAKDFVSSLLENDAEDRPTAREAIKHAWLKKLAGSDSHSSGEVPVNLLRTLQDFAHQNAMRRAVCGVMAFNMSPRDMQQVEDQFRQLDKNGSGTITLDELTDVLKKRMRLTELQAQHIFERLDQTGNNEIHYSEFLAAAVMSRDSLHRSVIREAFNKFDVEGKGYICLDDLRNVLGDEYGGTQVEDILSVVDVSQNGVIEYQEFVEALKERPPETNLVPFFEDRRQSSTDILRRASRRTLGRISRQQVWK